MADCVTVVGEIAVGKGSRGRGYRGHGQAGSRTGVGQWVAALLHHKMVYILASSKHLEARRATWRIPMAQRCHSDTVDGATRFCRDV